MSTFDMWAGSMFMLEEFPPKTLPARPGVSLSSVTAMAVSMEREKCRRDEERRTKQINYGYSTREYQYYIKAVPKKDRKRGDPVTPDKNIAETVSRRRWDGRIRMWRKAIHKWYDNNHLHPTTSSTSSSSFASGVCSEDRISLTSPIDYEVMIHNLSLEEKEDNRIQQGCSPTSQAMSIPSLTNYTLTSSSNVSCNAQGCNSNELYGGIYYQMMIQQNLILTWLFQNSSSPQFPSICELLQQFFAQQALILNCLVQQTPSNS